MAANPWFMYGEAQKLVLDGTIDLDTDSFRMVLVDNTYVLNQSTDALWSAISADEITGTGYTANGKAITPTIARSGLVTTFDCDDQSWASSTLANVAYAVIVRDADSNGALAAGDIPMFAMELEAGGSVSTTSGTLAITISATGVYTFTATAAA